MPIKNLLLILVFLSGLRSGIGDTPFYKHSYELLVQNPNQFIIGIDKNYFRNH